MASEGTPHDASEPAAGTAWLDTELVNLDDCSFDDVLNVPASLLAPFLGRTLLQVERPRMNLGGSGPPGRAD